MKHFFASLLPTICAFFIGASALAQTILIDPNGDGGFENGTTFTANGWTVANDVTNQWAVGTATFNGGVRGAYVSNDGGTTNAYTITVAQVSHFYRNVTFPAGENFILLKFDWKGQGESTFDRMRIYLVPTTTTPVAGTELTTGQIGAANYSLQATFTTTTVQIPASAAGTTQRLVFSWRNDASLGTQPPAAIDNISLTSQFASPLSGAYTINKNLPTGGTNFASFAEAFIFLNGLGVSGPTTFTVTGTADTVTYVEGNLTLGGLYVAGVSPSLLHTTLSATNTLTFVAASGKTINMSGAGTGATGGDFVFRLQGVDWVTFDGINIVDTATTDLRRFEFGYIINNASSADGANNNTIKNFSITLNKANAVLTNGPYGVVVANGTAILGTTVGTAGTYASRNNNNKIQNFTIQSVKRGIQFDGLPIPAFDEGNEVSGPPFTSATGGTWIGGSRITNWGGATSGTDYGIGIDGQKNLKVFNVQIDSGLATTAGTAQSGIHFGTAATTSDGADNVEIYNCVIRNLQHNLSTTSGNVGIRASGATLHTVKIYNTVIYDIRATAATGANVMGGMHLNVTGAGSRFELYNNSINITGATAAAGTAKGLRLDGLVGTVVIAKNNAIQVTGGGSTGGAILLDFGTIAPTLLDFSNNVYNVGVTSTARRMAVYGGATRQDLIDWQSTMATPSDGIDQRSAYGEPGFTSGTDLTISGTNRVNNSGVPISGLSTANDILGNPRSLTTPDLGAFEGDFSSGFTDAAGAGIQITPLEGSVSSEIRVLITDNINTAGNLKARLWYRGAPFTGDFSVFVPDVAPADSNNGEYRWGASLRTLAAGTYQYYIVVRDAAGNSFAVPTKRPGTASASLAFTTTGHPNWVDTVGIGVRTFQNAAAVLAGGTYTVGPTGTYPNLTAVAAEVSTKPLSGNVIFELQPTYTSAGEVFPIVFNQPSYTVPGPLTITIRPAAGVSSELVTAGNPGGSNNLIVLDGMRDMILDGRPGGTGTSRMWRIANTKDSAAANASGGAILLVNDALRNTLRYLTLEANTTTGFGGVVNIGSTFYGGQGNNFNTIDNCDIRNYAGAVVATPPNPIRGIATGGGTNALNRNNTYSNNLIHDFHSTTTNPIGIALFGEVGSTITGNSIYQTAPRTGLAAFALGIVVGAATGPGMTITNNFIGGSAPFCGGGPMTITNPTVGTQAVFYAMQINVGQFTTPTIINNNTMTNWDLTSANNSAGLLVSIGINLTTTTNQTPVSIKYNVIGSSTADTANPAIKLTSTNTAVPSNFSGFFASVNGVCEIVGNTIGGVKLMTTSTGTTGFIGIQQQTAGIATRIDSNLIGSPTVPGNIYQTTNAPVNGIVSLIGGSAITNNTIANILSLVPGGGAAQTFLGISGAAGVMTISNNTIRDVVSNSISTGTTGVAAATGINLTSTALAHVIEGNRIHSITVNPAAPATATRVQGIYISNSTSGGLVAKNHIYNLVNNATSTTAGLIGINNQFGANWTYVNNMISLGGGSSGDIIVRGFWDFSSPTGAANYYYNSVNIYGAVPGGVTETAAFYNSDGASTSLKAIKNNIFVNTRTGTDGFTRGFAVVHSSSAAALPAQDYNIYKTISDTVGQWQGTAQANKITLAGLQALGLDANTLDCIVVFLSPTDLHIHPNNSCPSNNATPIASVTDDFDGEARSATTPDRGADEYVFVPPVFPNLTATPDSLNFGAVEIGQQRQRSTLVRNSGGDTLRVTGITITNANYSATPTSFNLVAGDTQRVTVTFTAPPPGATNELGILRFTSNDPTPDSVKLVARSGVPHVALVPSLFDFTLFPSPDTTVATMYVVNTGTDTLAYELALVPVTPPGLRVSDQTVDDRVYEHLDLPKGATDVRSVSPGMEGTGGPDAFGYRWIDSDEPGGPVFNWIDITATAPFLDSASAWIPTGTFRPGDEGYFPVVLPFSFNFYGVPKDTLFIGTNGNVMFQRPTGNLFTNQPFPTQGGPIDNHIGVFWDDLEVRAGAKVYYGISGGSYVVSFENMARFAGTVPNYTFQIILNPNGTWKMQYLRMGFNGGILNSASIGMENFNGTIGLTVVHNAAYMHDSLAIFFGTSFVPWLSTNITSGTIAPGDSQSVQVRVHPAGMAAGSYQARVRATGNTPDTAFATVNLTVLQAPPPVVTNVFRGRRVPATSDTLGVTATITDTVGISSASLLYAIDGGAPQSVPMARISGTPQNGTYFGIIPGTANANGNRVEYRVRANSSSGQTTTTAVIAANSYFAGISPLSLDGVKAINPNGSIRFAGYYARVAGTVNSLNFTTSANRWSYYIQDGIGGINATRGGTLTPAQNVGDSIAVIGRIGQFRGVTQIEPDNTATDVTLLATGRPVPVIDLTVADYQANAEVYEGRLIRLTHLYRRDATPPWPPLGSDANIVMYQTTITDTVILRLDRDTQVPGTPEPTYPIRVTGVATQFTSTSAVFNDGYQITPSFATDVVSTLIDLSAAFDSSTARVNLSWATPPHPSIVIGGGFTEVSGAANDGEAHATVGVAKMTVSSPEVLDEVGTAFVRADKLNSFGARFADISSAARMTDVPVISSQLERFLTDFSTLSPEEVLVLTRYDVYRAIGAGAFALIDTAAPGATAYVDSRVEARTYRYYLVARFDNGVNVPSDTVTINVPFIRAEVEPNNTAAAANWMTLGYAIEAAIQPGGDVDFYRFTSAPGHLIVDATNTPANNQTDVVIALYDSSGSVMLYFVDRNYNDRLEFGLPYNGVYFVAIAGYDANETGPYTMFARIGTPTDPFEPDDGPLSRAFAGPNFDHVSTVITLPFSNDTTATLNPGVGAGMGFLFDVDYYRFAGTAGDSLEITVKTGTVGSTILHARTGLGRIDQPTSFRPAYFTGATNLVNAVTTNGGDMILRYRLPANQTYLIYVINHPSFGDAQAGPGARYLLQARTITVGVDDEPMVPTVYALEQNYPNPFNPETQIKYALPKESIVTLRVYNVLGQEVATLVNGEQGIGFHTVTWNGFNNAGVPSGSGMYFYRIEAKPSDGGNAFVDVRKMLLLK